MLAVLVGQAYGRAVHLLSSTVPGDESRINDHDRGQGDGMGTGPTAWALSAWHSICIALAITGPVIHPADSTVVDRGCFSTPIHMHGFQQMGRGKAGRDQIAWMRRSLLTRCRRRRLPEPRKAWSSRSSLLFVHIHYPKLYHTPSIAAVYPAACHFSGWGLLPRRTATSRRLLYPSRGQSTSSRYTSTCSPTSPASHPSDNGAQPSRRSCNNHTRSSRSAWTHLRPRYRATSKSH